MPKVRPIGSEAMKLKAQIKQIDDAKEYARISDELRMLKFKTRESHTDFARMLGMPKRTWEKRCANPASLTLPEIRRIHALAQRYGMEVSFL